MLPIGVALLGKCGLKGVVKQVGDPRVYTGPKNHYPDQGPALITNVRIVAGVHRLKFRFSKLRNLGGFLAVTARIV